MAGGSNEAKFDGVNSNDVFEDFKNAFGASLAGFGDSKDRPMWKLGQIPNTNLAIYMVAYPDSDTNWNFTVAFYTGPLNASNFNQLNTK